MGTAIVIIGIVVLIVGGVAVYKGMRADLKWSDKQERQKRNRDKFWNDRGR